MPDLLTFLRSDGTADSPDGGATFLRCTPLGKRYLKWGGVFIFFSILVGIFYAAVKAAGGRVVVHPTNVVRDIQIDAANVFKCNVSFKIKISHLSENIADITNNKYTFSDIKIDCPPIEAPTRQKRKKGSLECLVVTDNGRQAFKCPGIDRLIYPDEWPGWNWIPNLIPPPGRRWVEWLNPAKCGDQEDCSKFHKLRVIIFVVLGITGLCALLLLGLQCVACIRRKGVVSRDLKTIMTGQMQSLAPRPHGPPITFSLDGSPVEGTSESKNQKDNEARLGWIDEEPCKSLGGTSGGWTSWLFSQKPNKAVSYTIFVLHYHLAGMYP